MFDYVVLEIKGDNLYVKKHVLMLKNNFICESFICFNSNAPL